MQEHGIPETIVLIEEPGWIHDHKLYLSPRMWIEHVCRHPEPFANCGQGSTAASPCSHLVRILTDIGRAGNSPGDSEGCSHIQSFLHCPSHTRCQGNWSIVGRNTPMLMAAFKYKYNYCLLPFLWNLSESERTIERGSEGAYNGRASLFKEPV